MGDVVIKLPVRAGKEAELFGAYLDRFMESRCEEAERLAADSDAPYLMVHTDPMTEVEVKVLTFQERSAAQDFSFGWNQARGGLIVRTA